MSARWFAGAGVLAFLIGIVALLPARVVYPWLAPSEVRLAGISGTVWRGRAAHANVRGWYLRHLEWHVRPWALAIGRVQAQLTGEPQAGFFEATVSVGASGSVSVTAATASVSLSSLAGALRLPGLSGKASLRLQRLEIRDGLPVAAAGQLTVDELFAPAIYATSVLGGYRAEFFTRDDGIAASVEDTAGVLDLAGSLTLGRDRYYAFIAQLAPKPGIDDDLKNRLRFLGNPDARGHYELRLEGQL